MTRHPRRILAPGLVLLALALGACGSGAGGGTAALPAASGPATGPAAASSAHSGGTPSGGAPSSGTLSGGTQSGGATSGAAPGSAAPTPATSTPAPPATLTVEVAGLRARDEVHVRVGQRLRVQPPLARGTAVSVEVAPAAAGASADGVVARDAAAGPLVYRAARPGTARLVVTSGPRCATNQICPSYRVLVGSVVVVVGA